MTEQRHQCPVSGCTAQLPRSIFMCRTHWHQVPKNLQTKIWVTWRRRERAQTNAEEETWKQRHLAACRSALEIVRS